MRRQHGCLAERKAAEGERSGQHHGFGSESCGRGPRDPASVCPLVEAVAGSRGRGGEGRGPAWARLLGRVRERVCECAWGPGAPRVRPSVCAQICGRIGMTACTRIRVSTPRPSGRRRGRKWSKRSGYRWVHGSGLPLCAGAPRCSGSVPCPPSSCPGYACSLKPPPCSPSRSISVPAVLRLPLVPLSPWGADAAWR